MLPKMNGKTANTCEFYYDERKGKHGAFPYLSMGMENYETEQNLGK